MSDAEAKKVVEAGLKRGLIKPASVLKSETPAPVGCDYPIHIDGRRCQKLVTHQDSHYRLCDHHAQLRRTHGVEPQSL